MGKTAEEVQADLEKLTPEQRAEAEEKIEAEKVEAAEAAEAKETEEAEKAEAAEKAEIDLRDKLEREDKTPDEIDAAVEALKADAELEIVKDGETQLQFTQQQLDSVVTKRISRLNKKVAASSDASDAANTELEITKEQNKLLALRIEQLAEKKTLLEAPKPDDFDDGRDDPEFIKKSAEYTSSLISQEVAKQVHAATEVTTQTAVAEASQKDLHTRQIKHYEAAAELGAKDYEETEDKAIEILGTDFTNQIINNFEDAHILLYNMGKNPIVLQTITEMLKTNPIKGVAELGRLSAELKLKPKTKRAPDPDKDIQGDGQPAGKRGPKGASYS